MNRRALVVSLALLLLCTPLTAQLTTARLQQVLDGWASLDPAKAGVFYAKDPGLVFYDVAPRAYKGWAEYDKGTRELFKTVKSISFKMHDAAVHNAGNTAWASALVDTELVPKQGKAEKIDARWTSVWEKRGSDWLIVHDHFSAPLPEPAPPPPKPKPAAKKKP